MREEKKCKTIINSIVIAVAILIGIATLVVVLVVERYSTSFNILMTSVYIVLCFVPILLHIIFHWQIPPYMNICYFAFLVLSTVGGTIFGLYNMIAVYDIILHTASGLLLAGFGLYLFRVLNKTNTENIILVVLFIIGFAVTCGVIWEVWEFWTDELLLLNSQRHTTLDGVALLGHEALLDTMYDLMSDFVGAVIFAVIYALYHRLYKTNKNTRTDKKSCR